MTEANKERVLCCGFQCLSCLVELQVAATLLSVESNQVPQEYPVK